MLAKGGGCAECWQGVVVVLSAGKGGGCGLEHVAGGRAGVCVLQSRRLHGTGGRLTHIRNPPELLYAPTCIVRTCSVGAVSAQCT